MIPPLNEHGCLPEGVHNCTMEEVATRFGGFLTSDRRPQLWARFTEFMRELAMCGFMEAVLIDGSFVTAAPEPNDVDLVLVTMPNYNLSMEMPPAVYNLLSQRRMRRRFGFDIVVVKDRSDDLEQAMAFFSQVKQRPGVKREF